VSSTDEVQAVGDPARVRQVLRNLLTNAERYGGPEVAVSVEVDGPWVHVDVIDNGAGLPPDEWEPIFELYHRAHHQKSRPESVGIGLAVSRQLADLMGGSLTYSRRADRSVFRLTLQSPA
jgi:signal transduction histidine kinase